MAPLREGFSTGAAANDYIAVPANAGRRHATSLMARWLVGVTGPRCLLRRARA
jgi:hypothetical protein